MTIEEMIAKQIRIERQEQPAITSISFDRHAANAFQSYVQAALGFSIRRGGFLYGTIDDEDKVQVVRYLEKWASPAGLARYRHDDSNLAFSAHNRMLNNYLHSRLSSCMSPLKKGAQIT